MRWHILALVTLAFALSAMSALGVAPLAPLMRDALGLARAQVGLFIPAVYLGGIVMALPAGWLVDRLGVRPTLALGQLLTGASVVLAAASPTVPLMLACLVAAGFGFAVVNPATGKAILDWFPPYRRGMAMGIKQTGLTLGGVVGALTLPPLAVEAGWREALAVSGAAAIASATLVAVAYRNPAVRRAPQPAARPRLTGVGALLRRPGVLVLFTCGFALSIGQASVLAYLALFVRDEFAVTAIVAGQALALAQAGGASSRLGWGFVSDWFFGGRRRPGVIVTAVASALAYVGFALGDRLPWPVALGLVAAAGAGAFGWVGLYFTLVAEIGGARQAGVFTGVAVVFAWSGVLVGPLLFGAALDAAGSYAAPWLLLAAIAVTSAIALARLEPLVQRGAVPEPSETPAGGGARADADG
ncbi:MAG: MFS transporter [Candidatus Rokuibacteriota bacterium]